MLRHARWLLLAVLIVIPSLMNQYFRSIDNLEGFLQSIGVLLLLAMGETIVLLVAGIDLSVGAVVALGSVVLALLLALGLPLAVAVPLTVGCGMGVGLLNGLGVVLLGIPSFIVSFATMGIATSAGLVASNGNRISLPPDSALAGLAAGTVAGMPLQIWLALAVLLAGSWCLANTRTGRHLYAVGGSYQASRLSGVPAARVVVVAFVLSGLFAGLAAVVYTSRIVSGNPIGGANLSHPLIFTLPQRLEKNLRWTLPRQISPSAA